ncbi:DnaJ domain-containing protein [Hyphomicrobium sp. D-2]|uniref:J domain-containing protein n=1 Tax=Hyphomicrobium sp. D-2 TaxID=3041621 RepID=UPI00245661DA|nr:DnaJ domain-containing protein [Hyphomicrobium sp. D-2]MDH4983540.1 DnaJ domain-containing protein [Hyphomicrobium sp. D-2]
MKLDSKYFDSIRVSSKRQRTAAPAREERHPRCQWKGCKSPGDHKAPRGRGRDGQFYFFCLEHVRQYNATYNYFDGMNDSEVQEFQKDAMTGHRPTWKVGANSPPPEGAAAGAPPPPDAAAAPGVGAKTMDPHSFFARRERAARQRAEAAAGKRRVVKPLEKKSLETLDLALHASRDEIKARFKALVKIYHPDANGGDARSGEKLREIIQAYNFLKQAGLV